MDHLAESRKVVLGHIRRLAKVVGLLNQRIGQAPGLVPIKAMPRKPKGTARQPTGSLGRLDPPFSTVKP
jgi:hypothetical protein